MLVAAGPPRELLEHPPDPAVAQFLGYDGLLEDGDEILLTRPAHVALDPAGKRIYAGGDDAAIHIQCGHMFKEAAILPKAEEHYKLAHELTPDDPDLAIKLQRLSGRAYLTWAENATESAEIRRGYSLSVRRFLEAGNLRVATGAGTARSNASP